MSNPPTQLTNDDLLSTVDTYIHDDYFIDGEPVVVLYPSAREIGSNLRLEDGRDSEGFAINSADDDDDDDEREPVRSVYQGEVVMENIRTAEISNCTDLQTLREARRLSKKVVADRLGVSCVKYATWECGQVKFPSEYLRPLSRELGASVDAILNLLDIATNNTGIDRKERRVKGIDFRPTRYQLVIRPPEDCPRNQLVLPEFWNRQELSV